MTARCVFCDRIERGEFDYSDSFGVAFEPLNPVTPGHLLVVPRRHVSSVLGDPAEAGAAMRFAGYLANKLDIPAANFITSAGSAATQTVFHLHIHIVPRHDGDGLAPLPWTGPVPGHGAGCLTPGAVYSTHVSGNGLAATVDFGQVLDLSEDEARELDAEAHDALERVLARHWPRAEAP